MYLATKPPNRSIVSATRLIGGDHLAQISGSSRVGERGRAHKIAEHHGELAVLGVVPLPGLGRQMCGWKCGGAGKLDSRRQHLAPMPLKRDAKLFEILISQMTQDGDVDIVLDKALGVLGQTERGQPLRDRGHLLPSRFHRRA